MTLVNDVLFSYPDEMNPKEAAAYLAEEKQLWRDKGKELGKMVLSLEGDEVIINSFEKSPIKRIRRITGYLSESSNFNSAKQAELDARVVHS